MLVLLKVFSLFYLAIKINDLIKFSNTRRTININIKILINRTEDIICIKIIIIINSILIAVIVKKHAVF